MGGSRRAKVCADTPVRQGCHEGQRACGLDRKSHLCKSTCTSGEARVCPDPVVIQELSDWWKCYRSLWEWEGGGGVSTQNAIETAPPFGLNLKDVFKPGEGRNNL